MRFREFAPRKRNRDQQVDEVLPAVAAVGGIAARAAGGALARGVGSLAKSAVSAVGNKAKALFTPKGFQRTMAGQAGTQAGNAAFKQNNPQDQQGTTPPVQIKPGVKILHPGLGPTKIKSIQGKNAVLDTQKDLGQDIQVDQNELLAVLGQGQEQGQQVKK